jgi:hypothetical protein
MERSFGSSVSVTVDETDPRDPTVRCDRCGSRGTVARAVRHTDPPLVLRYCSLCWPAAQEELEARQRDELKQWQEARRASFDMRNRDAGGKSASLPPPAAWSSASRSWYDTRRFLALIAQPVKGGPAPTLSDLAAIAADIRGKAAEMDGPIPRDVEDFLAKYSPPAA